MISGRVASAASGALVALLVTGVTGAGAATVASLDVGDVTPRWNASVERVLPVGPSVVNEIFFDIEVSPAADFSSDVQIQIVTPSSTAYSYRGDSSFGWPQNIPAGQAWSYTGGFAITPENGEGSWTFTFISGWDRHTYLSGSTIELRGSSGVGVIPLPAGLPLLLGALGLLGLARLRQQSSAGSGLA